jgi:hypothetical protein
MAETYVKILDFVEQLGLREHQLNTDTHRVALTNSTPLNTNTILSNITQIANGNGYVTLGEDAQNTWAETAGTATCTATAITWTSSGAGMATFQHCVYYSNQTNVTLVNPLICFWTRAAGALTLAVGETFTLKFNSLTGAQPVFTLA